MKIQDLSTTTVTPAKPIPGQRRASISQVDVKLLDRRKRQTPKELCSRFCQEDFLSDEPKRSPQIFDVGSTMTSQEQQRPLTSPHGNKAFGTSSSSAFSTTSITSGGIYQPTMSGPSYQQQQGLLPSPNLKKKKLRRFSTHGMELMENCPLSDVSSVIESDKQIEKQSKLIEEEEREKFSPNMMEEDEDRVVFPTHLLQDLRSAMEDEEK
ncbi:hypothetical protein ABK040_002962 [Willaertia magna]